MSAAEANWMDRALAEMKDPQAATAEVTQTSWCTWDVRIRHGILEHGPVMVFGSRAHALHVAARRLDRYRRRKTREQQREQQRVTLT